MSYCVVCGQDVRYMDFGSHRCNPKKVRAIDRKDRKATDEPDAEELDEEGRLEEWEARMALYDDREEYRHTEKRRYS